MRKHPHGRGEDDASMSISHDPSETPPRAWGRLASVGRAYNMEGNTPTGVGKTLLMTMRRMRCGKHPHGRGEDCRGKSVIRLGKETPPRAWGRRHNKITFTKISRNTPTGVGKT